jgi:NodT family efflux transporter outer membrane factor (OMF) lipoprotein
VDKQVKQLKNMKNNILKYGLLGVVLVAGLNSCQVMNRYKSPEINVENLYRDIPANDTTTIASIPWRHYFTDPKLQGLIEEGLENNFDMRVALAGIEQAHAYLKQSRLAYLPNLALAGTVTHNRHAGNKNGKVEALSQSANQYSLGLGATWELDIWGKLNRQSRATYAQYLNSQETKRLIQSNIISGIAIYYYTLLSLDEQLRISKESVELLKETVTTMEALKEAGQLNEASVVQTKATLYNTMVSIPDLEMAVYETENALSLLLGRRGGGVERSTFAQQEVPGELMAGVPAQLLANRPDVKSAELKFRQTFELVNVAQASFYPSITLNSGSFIGYASTTLSGFFKPANLAASIIGGLAQPLFAKRQLVTNLEVAKGNQKIALLNFEKAVLTAGNEVSDIMNKFNSFEAKNQSRDLQIESLKLSVEYTPLLLTAGEANYLEVITAQANLLNAQLGQVNDKLQQLQASVNLYKALGGGVQ